MIVSYLGGRFGRKIVPDYVVQAALIAKQTGRPVELIRTRVLGTNDLVFCVAERGAQFTNEIVKVRRLDKGVRPDLIVQLGSRHYFRPVLDQNSKQLEGIWCEMQRARAVADLEPIEIDREIAKPDRH